MPRRPKTRATKPKLPVGEIELQEYFASGELDRIAERHQIPFERLMSVFKVALTDFRIAKLLWISTKASRASVPVARSRAVKSICKKVDEVLAAVRGSSGEMRSSVLARSPVQARIDLAVPATARLEGGTLIVDRASDRVEKLLLQTISILEAAVDLRAEVGQRRRNDYLLIAAKPLYSLWFRVHGNKLKNKYGLSYTSGGRNRESDGPATRFLSDCLSCMDKGRKNYRSYVRLHAQELKQYIDTGN